MNKVRAIQFATYGVTNVHPIAVVFMVLMSSLALAGRRTAVVLAVIAVCVFMPMEQRVVLGGLDVSMPRFIMIVAWIRVFARGEHRGFSLGKLDRVFLLWVVSASLFHVLRVGPSGIVYRLGVSFDMLTAFFLMRVLVRTPSQLFVVWRHLARIVIVLGPLIMYEALTLHNVFGFLNYAGFEGVAVRDGRARAQGPLSHPILAGTLGSAVLPVFISLYLGHRNQRLLFASACIAATMLVLGAGSSGPVVAYVVALIGWGMWRFRKHMRRILVAGFFAGVVVHFAREKPIWHLIGRLSFGSGTGWHRYRLIDAFVNRFGEWALVGTDNTAHWGWGLQDTTNQYVMEGIKGGLVTLVLFLILLRISFVELRIARERFERPNRSSRPLAMLAWGTSVSLAVHCTSFLSVSYFGHIVQFFILFVASVPALARGTKRARSTVAPMSTSTPTAIPATRFRSG